MPQRLSRSIILGGMAAIAETLYLGLSPAGAAQYVYKFAHPYPITDPPHIRMAQMAAAVLAETNGRLEIQLYPNSSLGSQASMTEQLRAGAIQFMITGNGSWGGVVPVAQIESLGFAFRTKTQPCEALDGPLGAYIRSQFALKNIYVLERVLEIGFFQVTSSARPIKAPSDFAGFRVRTPPAPIVVDLFKQLGAEPVALGAEQMYTACQTHIVDGTELPLSGVEAFRIYEVQKYVSLTNHMWAGAWIASNADAWAALPGDIQAVVTRNANKYALLERTDMYSLNDSVAGKLQSQGITFNTPDTASMRARLGPYYAHWKEQFGDPAWSLLEQKLGKLG